MKRMILFMLVVTILAGCGKQEKIQEIVNGMTEVTAQEEEVITMEDVEYISPAENFAGGNGTQEDPYQIETAEQLALLSELCSHEKYWELDVDEAMEYIKGHYVLIADIELNDVSDFAMWDIRAPKWQWKPIGGTYQFMGSFDGNGHTISGLYICNTKNIREAELFEEGYCPGIFGNTSNAIIKNVTLKDSYIVVNGQVDYAGGIVASAYKTDIVNCQSEIKMELEDCVQGGGIVGILQYGNIQKCIFNGKISYGQNSYIGGIGGSASYFNTISGCYNNGKFEIKEGGDAFSHVGGICGRISPKEDSLLEDCINESNLEVKEAQNLGGISGIMSLDQVRHIDLGETTISMPAHLTVKNCINKGSLSSESNDYAVGGITSEIFNTSSRIDNEITDMRVEIINCSNEGKIESVYSAAGIVGRCVSASMWRIENCTNTGNIISNGYAGGIVAFAEPSNLESKIEKCVNNGKVQAEISGGGILGHLIGFSLSVSEKDAGDVIIDGCKNQGSILVEDSIYGTGGIVGSCASNVSTLFIQKCANEGEVRGEGSCRMGGILGNSAFANAKEYKGIGFYISDCVNLGTLIQGKGDYLLKTEEREIRQLTQEELEKYMADINVAVAGGTDIGGIVGYCKQGILENCVNLGKIMMEQEKYVVYCLADIVDEENLIYIGGICGLYDYSERTQENTGMKNCIYSESLPMAAFAPYGNDNTEVQTLSIKELQKRAEEILR